MGHLTETTEKLSEALDALEFAWGIICNAGGSDWTRESPEWQQAAARFRQQYFAILDANGYAPAIETLLTETVPTPAPPTKRSWLTRLLQRLSASLPTISEKANG